MLNSSDNSSDCFIPPLTTPPAVNYIQACVALLLGVTGFLTNLLILVLIGRYKRLHQRLMYLGLHIVVIDLVYTLTIPPVIFTSGVVGEWLLGDAMCNVLGVVHDFFAMFRFAMTLVLAVDRFTSVFWPFFYELHSVYLIMALVIGTYVVSVLRVLLPLDGVFSCFEYIPTFKTCTAYSGCSEKCFWLVVVNVVTIIIFGVILPLVLYIVLFCKTKAIKRKLGVVGRSFAVGGVSNYSVVTVTGASRSDQLDLSIHGVVAGDGEDDVKEAFGSEFSKDSTSGDAGMECNSPSCPHSKDDNQDSGTSKGIPQHHTHCGKGVIPKSRIIIESEEEFGCEYHKVEGKGDSDQALEAKPADISTESVVLQSANVTTRNLVSQSADVSNMSSQHADISNKHADISSNWTEKNDFPLGLNRGSYDIDHHNLTNSLSSHLQGGETAAVVKPKPLETESGFGTKPGDDHTPRRTSDNTMTSSTKNTERIIRKLNSNTRMNVTMFILLMSVIGCTTPAFLLYGVQFLYLEPEPNIFIVNMLIGRTCFNLLPIVDSIAIMRHQEFRICLRRFIRSIKWKIWGNS